MFFDWLTMYQDFDFQLPLIGNRHFIAVDTGTGEELGVKQETVRHAGSFSTSINIRISGNRVTVSGNPSRVNRIDNLFGFTTIESCVEVFNRILDQYGLPAFTKATKVWYVAGEGAKIRTLTDGAVITELHITSNVSTGAIDAHTDTFIRSLSSLPYRNSIPRLHGNGKTVDWLTKSGEGSTLIYPSVYNKAHEIELHSAPKIKRRYGSTSSEYKYLLKVIDYCRSNGIARFEQKLKSAFLRRNNLQFYGLSNYDKLRPIHQEFLDLPERLQVEHMNLETITQQLINNGICEHTKAANATTLYAIQWMHGHKFDLSKKQVQTHRARLRQIGIDIALPCDLTKFGLVTVKSAHKIELKNVSIPRWYRRPMVQLRLVS